MKRYLQAAVITLATTGLLAHDSVIAESTSQQVTVIELFTSQSCYSCPPAEKLLGELAERDDIIALEHHVDYWDQLVYGSAGRWKDIFSSPEATKRQQSYNRTIQGRGYSYTPQMVFDGKTEAVGSRKREVGRAISMVERDRGERLDVAIVRRSEGGLSITVDGAVAGEAGIWLLHVKDRAEVRPTGGENKDKDLVNHNVVRDVRRVGDWTGEKAMIDVADYTFDEGFSCYVLVQSDRLGPIIGAARCPSVSS